ncbi:MAG: manganese ABC transporter ATP-binding protein [Desulfobulbus propionicus]|nr:MAG: manganese ABC transporter ATP-binding protein [Desulfobulbus propionicus]
MRGQDTLHDGPSLTVEHLNLRLGGNHVLEDISLSVEPGSIHCILGPNGGGKTSLLRALLGQMPHSGTIRIRWPNRKKITGYVPQALDFDRTLPLTVGDFMAMICQKRPVFLGQGKKRKALIHEALDQVGMADKIGYHFGGLSGGERQRILLAQALIPAPNLLILDEPATGLDREGARIMRIILKKLQKEGTTMLMIHHDIAEVRTIGSMVTCINRKVLFSGTPKEVLTPETILSIFSSNQY